ncbi:hypothetical protein CBP52_09645 [Cellulomonas sp. PSBB021]|nr:hypothetical protein CBP52_09645 [Cellulomonas sp. PSBB021]
MRRHSPARAPPGRNASPLVTRAGELHPLPDRAYQARREGLLEDDPAFPRADVLVGFVQAVLVSWDGRPTGPVE